jgi:prepilin-type N-terminal cleavage/methylation domain-containing protein
MYKKGFTLIELLVTIAIISLIASIVFVNIANARTAANVLYTRQMARSYILALQQYADKNGRYPDPSPLSDNTDLASYCLGNNFCFPESSTVPENAKLNSEFLSVMSSLPNVQKKPLQVTAGSQFGLIYKCYDELTGPNYPYCRLPSVTFVIEGVPPGSNECGNVYEWNYAFVFKPTENGNTRCEVFMRQP